MAKDILSFVKKFPSKKFSAGETLHAAGQNPSSLFFLRRGYVRQFAISSEGKELTIHIYEKESIFPLLWAVKKSPFDFNLSALGEVSVYLVPRSEFLRFLKNNPEELFSLTVRLLLGLEGLSKRVEIMGFESAQKRVSQSLLYLSKHFGKKYSFSHEDIASLTGLTRERVSIEMKKLKDKKAISYSRKKIKILSPEKLLL